MTWQDATLGGDEGAFTGNYFLITWDVLLEPPDWDAERPVVFLSFLTEDAARVWTGPGDPEDPATWRSNWYSISVMDNATVEVVNIRFVCYPSSPYGSKPQVTGRAVTLPDPSD